MSRSSPGRYALHGFAKNVSNFKATDAGGRALDFVHDTPDSWLVTPRGGTAVCSYTLYGDRVDGTYAAIDATHAHLNLPAALIWAKDLEHAPSTLSFEVPANSGWTAHTQLLSNPDGSFSAPNLQMLMDSPVELSASSVFEWTLDHHTFRLALHHQASAAAASSFAEMCKTVVAEERAVFGYFPKYDTGAYTFLVDYLPYANGDGMEHRDSTVITAPHDLDESARRAVGTVAHEFFHSWNVKRIRPASLEPFDFERADMSGELWFAEGFTNYYGELILARTKLSTFDELATQLSHAVNAVLNSPGRDIYSPVGMSQQAPFVDAATSNDPTNTVNDFISYYTYGEALAFGVDLSIRARFPGKSLDDWMRTMWREHPDTDRPYTIADLEAALAETTGDAAFAHELFAKHIQGREPLDYEKLCAPAGLALTLARPGKVWLGATRLNATASGIELTAPTLRGSPLYKAGIDRGDEIEECGNESVKTTAKLDSCLASHKPGDTLALKVRTRSGAVSVNVLLAQDPAIVLTPYEHAGRPANADITEFRAQWLNSKSLTTLP